MLNQNNLIDKFSNILPKIESESDIYFEHFSMDGTLCVPLEEGVMTPYDFIRREKINIWNSVPSIVGFMKKMGYLSNGAFPSIEYSMFCGEQFPKHYADAWRVAAPNSTIENLYGPTKATIYTSRYLYSKSKEKELFCKNIIPIGRMVSSDEYQGTLLWMLSDASSYLNGAIIPVEKKGVYMVTLQ